MNHNTQDIARDERGNETHPAFGVVTVNRVQSTGTYLFDSEAEHSTFMTVRVSQARRRRDMHSDHVFGGNRIIEFSLSMAQWASLVSSAGNGHGAPVTLEWTAEDGLLPSLPEPDRFQVAFDEVESAAEQAFAAIKEAVALVSEKPTKANIRNLESVVANATPNVKFAGTQLVKFHEKSVAKVRADIEALGRPQQTQLEA